jgi:hypothetical protein
VWKVLGIKLCAEGFRSSDGIRINWRPAPPTVSLAISCGVSTTPVGTSGLSASAIKEKSPVQSDGWGSLVDEIFTGDKS